MNFIAVSSSRGTTLQAVIDRMQDGSLQAECLGLVTDKADRGCAAKAKAAGIPVRVVERSKNEDRSAYAIRLDAALKDLGVNQHTIVALIGWMWILPEEFVSAHSLINIHPALLPKYGGDGMYGLHVHQAVLDSGDTETGITIHPVDAGVDTGEILLQKTCPVLPGDTPETLQARVQELEKQWYPEVLAMMDSAK